MSKIYEYHVKDSKGNEISLEDYKGKVLLIVNTASKCGFTPQYKELQQLHDEYHEKGLEILAFPCNQFAKQESGSNEDIQEFCQINYGLSFPVMAKIDVNGENADPLYKYLKDEKGGGILGKKIKWNFTKFLIDENGNVVKRYAPIVKPLDMKGDIEQLIK
jgi:glutathione peroxidase